tara:strand:- start:12810 stop:14135 length:1326 start_codon:yes stop_codon:yes gene_type:complete
MSTFFSGQAGQDVSGVSIDDTRRVFNFGDRVAELAPQQSPFFVYLSKVAKKATNDPVFKYLEQRHQWQRRNFHLGEAVSSAAYTAGTTYIHDSGDDLVKTYVNYDKYGQITSLEYQPEFFVEGLIVAIKDNGGTARRFRVDATPSVTSGTGTVDVKLLALESGTFVFADDAVGQVIGSAHAEGGQEPEGWEDAMIDAEGYTQIFKTGMSIFSGTSLATEYRGIKNEFQRVWTDKLMEHKMDIENAMLFGKGGSSNEQSGSAPTRYTDGIITKTEASGKVYNMTYASSGYDAFLDAMEDFFAPEGGNSGNKLVLASRKVITYLNKLGSGSFLNNTVGSSQYKLDVQNIPGQFGHTVTKVNTIFGNLHFVAEPLLRGPWEDYACAVDLKNVAYRPLVGNGISRDTYIETNIQDNGTDGRKDQVITEAGLEISLPETHAVLKFS